MKKFILIVFAAFLCFICASAQEAAVPKKAASAPKKGVYVWINPGLLILHNQAEVGVSVPLSNKWSAVGSVRGGFYNSDYSASTMFGGNLGARFWPWHVNHEMWLQGCLSYSGNNIKAKESTSNPVFNNKYGLSLAAGYTIAVTRTLSFEVGVGGRVGYADATTPESYSTRFGSGKHYFAEMDLIDLGLVLVF